MPDPISGRLFAAPPSTVGIEDPVVRAAIDSLISAHNVRNGLVGSGENRFITKAELDDLGITIHKGSIGPSTSASQLINATTLGRYVKAIDELPDVDTGEIIGWGADVYSTKQKGSIVAGHFHAATSQQHIGNVFGLSVESYNARDKAPINADSQLFGAAISVVNMIPFSTARRHTGISLTFKNRLDAEGYAPFHGPGAQLEQGWSYNRNTSALNINSGGGRVGNANNPFDGNPQIPCGWNCGVYFEPSGLDETYPGAADAIGIDMSGLANYGPEGRQFSKRVKSLIALPPNAPITWDGSGFDVQTLFNDRTGNLEFRSGRAMHAGINFSTGALYQNGETNFIQTAPYGSELLNMGSGSRLTHDVLANFAFHSMINIVIDGSRYYIPFYRYSPQPVNPPA